MTQLSKEIHAIEAKIAVKQKELGRLEKQKKALLAKQTKEAVFSSTPAEKIFENNLLRQQGGTGI